jgi:hypothetical protein
MRGRWLGALVLSACSFDVRSLPGAGDAAIADGPVVADAAAADAIPDAVAVPDVARPDAVVSDVSEAPDAPPPPPDAPPEPPDAPPCVVECIDDANLRTCPGGASLACALGCISGPSPHCGVQIVSNGVPPDLTSGTAGLTVSSGATYIVNTDSGAIVTGGGMPVRAAGTGVVSGIGFFQVGNLSVLTASSVTVEGGGALRPAGTRALVLLSAGDVTIRGIVNVSATSCTGFDQVRFCGGPGGGAGARGEILASGCGPGGAGVFGQTIDETGGGGGGLGTAGAAGGDISVAEPGGAAGAACGEESLVPLVGGSGGGKGGSGGNGGGGGGALQITSFTRIVLEKTTNAAAGITAGGGGGGAGNNGDGGGGGGSGGALLLEAPQVTLEDGTIVAANGGGGGAGDGGGEGSAGALSTAAAPGGNGGRIGGDGGALGRNPVTGMGGGDGTGAGGGAAGRVRINARTITGALTQVSPAPSTGPVPTQ